MRDVWTSLLSLLWKRVVVDARFIFVAPFAGNFENFANYAGSGRFQKSALPYRSFFEVSQIALLIIGEHNVADRASPRRRRLTSNVQRLQSLVSHFQRIDGHELDVHETLQGSSCARLCFRAKANMERLEEGPATRLPNREVATGKALLLSLSLSLFVSRFDAYIE